MTVLPFTFAWVNETDTTFDPTTMNVEDEELVSFEMKHDEGQVPYLDMVVRNPRIGLLNPSRKVWGWLAWKSPASHPIYAGALVPLFFGVLVGVPTSLFLEKVTLKFVARSSQFIANKQALAETMRSAPYYDPIWLETDKRDDPDSILEGWSALWHIDRTTLDITASDILVGEDGLVVFDEDHAIYSSVSLTLGQPPLTNVRVEATVNWNQRTGGNFPVPPVHISSYTGETLLSEWPKAGASIGGGYTVESSFVTDTYLISQTPTTSFSYDWTNTDPNPGQCSNASASSSSSGPALLAPDPLSAVLTGYVQSGICFPDSDPPINRPATVSSTGIIVPLWNVGMAMTIRYEASRQFSELLAFDLITSTQSILASPTVSQHTELLTLSSVDVGEPLIEVDAWTNFADQHVGLAQIIFPNNPTKPGGLAYQICVQAGTAGHNEPNFSNLVGTTTTDNGVIWASMGTSPLTTAWRWSPASYVPVGQIALMQSRTFNLATGEFELVPGSTSYYICTGAGYTNGTYSEFVYTPPVQSNVEGTPAPRHISVINPPPTLGTVGTIVEDGSVQWTVLGHSPSSLGIPIGGSPTDVTARCFFPTTRGLRSVEYLISRARARLRFRSRAVNVGWECRFDDAVGLSCRKSASLTDPRLPGGTATGKVTSYSLIASGDGKLRGKVEIGCAIGHGDSILTIAGTPTYVNTGYVTTGYQVNDGEMVAHGSGDTTYSKPIFVGFDDGLRFPLRFDTCSDGGRISGKVSTQRGVIKASFKATVELQYLTSNVGNSIGDGNVHQSGIDAATAWAITREQLILASQATPYVMAANPITWTALFLPCDGSGPFGGAYEIDTSPLVITKGIDLEAPSAP